MLAYGFCYTVALVQFVGSLYEVKKRNAFSNAYDYATPTYPINVMYFFFFAICITSVIYSYMEKDKKYSYMLTQPYSRDSIVITKAISFSVSYIVPTAIYGLISFIILLINKAYIGSYFTKVSTELFLKLFGIIAILTFISILIQLFQMMFGKMIAGIIFPFIYYFMLFFSLNIMGSFISKRLGELRTTIDHLNMFLFSTGRITVNTSEFKTLFYLALRYLEKSYFLASLILLLVSICVMFLIINLNRKIKVENTSDIFLFKFSETIFKAIFSLAFTVVGSLFISGAIYYLYSSIIGMNVSTDLMNKYGIAGKEAIEQNLYLVLNLLWIPLYMFIYKLLGKLMKKRRAL
jgi:ABC-type transport system involved in multi-copper enzyme maturation permease subunit